MQSEKSDEEISRVERAFYQGRESEQMAVGLMNGDKRQETRLVLV